MFHIAANIAFSAIIISTALWVAKHNPSLGGFIVSLPLSTMIILMLSRIRGDSAVNTVALAKSIFVAIPSTLTFFIPFLLAERLKLHFWTSYILGILFLIISFWIHKRLIILWKI